jgi:hypothetical protein
MEIPTTQHEIIIKRGEPKFEGMTTAKTMRNWIIGRISKYGKGRTSQDLEYRMIFEGILNAHDFFYPQTTLEVPVESWKGKSSFEILDLVDSIKIIKYQKSSKGEEPSKIETNVNKEDMKLLIYCIKFLSNEYERIPTNILSMLYSRKLNLNHSGWKKGDNPIFSDRNFHNLYTLCLGSLDRLGIVQYKGGLTKYLNNKIEFQEALENSKQEVKKR